MLRAPFFDSLSLKILSKTCNVRFKDTIYIIYLGKQNLAQVMEFIRDTVLVHVQIILSSVNISALSLINVELHQQEKSFRSSFQGPRS